ncbi:MAG: hypothetical protein L6Q95_16380, partial [Planctomycetes bacterium]|nr:hypothetical protein [Planctomycetota bacterium]
IGDLDAALARGDAKGAREAAVRARALLAAWADDLESRERRIGERETPVEKRVLDLEKRLAELIGKHAAR